MSEATINQRPAGNIIARLWRGDVSLGVTYWVFGVLAAYALHIVTYVVTYTTAAAADRMSITAVQALLYGMPALLILYSAFMVVPIWRSADKYRVLKPTRKGYAALAQVASILGLILFTWSMVNLTSTNRNVLAELDDSRTAANDKEQLKAIVAKANADLPRKLDNITTLTRIDYDDSGYKYYETISAKVDMKVFPQAVRQGQSSALCKDEQTRGALNRNLSYTYFYSDPNRHPILEMKITKADCVKAAG